MFTYISRQLASVEEVHKPKRSLTRRRAEADELTIGRVIEMGFAGLFDNVIIACLRKEDKVSDLSMEEMIWLP